MSAETANADAFAKAMDEWRAAELQGLARYVDGAQMHAIVSAMDQAAAAMDLIKTKSLSFAHRKQFEAARQHLAIVRAELPQSR